ncbi:MAG: hypothetical protein ABIE75_04465 [Candidatus Omnitrophota bacterium]
MITLTRSEALKAPIINNNALPLRCLSPFLEKDVTINLKIAKINVIPKKIKRKEIKRKYSRFRSGTLALMVSDKEE